MLQLTALALLSLLQALQSLKIFKNDFTQKHILFEHLTANFGPQKGDYNVSAQLQLMSPVLGCSINQYESDGNYEQIYNNNIVLIKRGNCTFSDKIYHAQLLGAVGVVVGDNGNTEEWVTMDKTDDRNIIIPSVFVQHNTYNKLYNLLQNISNTTNNQQSTASTSITSTMSTSSNSGNSKSDPTFGMHLAMGQILSFVGFKTESSKSATTGASSTNSDNDNSFTALYVILDKNGEYDATTSYSAWLTVIGLIILLIPTIWCLVGSVMMLKKLFKMVLGRYKRSKRLNSIPIIRYKGKQTGENDDNNDINDVESVISNDEDENNNNNDIIDNNGNNTPSKQKSLISKIVNKKYDTVESFETFDMITTENDKDDDNEDNKDGNNKTFSSRLDFAAIAMKSKLNLSGNRFNLGHRLINNVDTINEQPLNDECVICLDDFKINEKIKLLPCLHAFHPKCIDPWLLTSSDLCPMCKRSIFNDNTNKESEVSEITNVNNNNNMDDNNNNNDNELDSDASPISVNEEEINKSDNNDHNENVSGLSGFDANECIVVTNQNDLVIDQDNQNITSQNANKDEE